MMVFGIFCFFFILSLFFGLLLSVAAKFFAVSKDERVEAVQAVLPNANCGACGFPGCSGYAEAIIHGGAPLNRCAPGGRAVYQKLAALLGAAEEEAASEPQVAFVHCAGGREQARQKFYYTGSDDCRIRMQLFDGDKLCGYGCLGGGTCASVCPTRAIHDNGHSVMQVDADLCIGCGLCVSVCPTRVIRLIPKSAPFAVACSSKDPGGKVRKTCQSGCIGCKLCVTQSPEGGFSVTDHLSSIDYRATGDRLAAMKACPVHCILQLKSNGIQSSE